MKIKICGITNRVDAINTVSLGADAIGFVFAESSRQVTPKEVKKIMQVLPPYITTVGLFVNESVKKVIETMQFCKLDVVQLHGQETPEYCKKIPYRIVKAFNIQDEASLKPIEKYVTSAILLDAHAENKQGGTGHTFNWELVQYLYQKYYIILAGGLNSENVEEAIRTTKPYAVDVSSGVEKSPGKKDFKKIKEFIEKVRNIEKNIIQEDI